MTNSYVEVMGFKTNASVLSVHTEMWLLQSIDNKNYVLDIILWLTDVVRSWPILHDLFLKHDSLSAFKRTC